MVTVDITILFNGERSRYILDLLVFDMSLFSLSLSLLISFFFLGFGVFRVVGFATSQ